MGKQILKSGLISGALLTVLFLASHFLYTKDFTPEKWTIGEIIGYSSMIFALTAVFFGIKSYRDRVLGGKITFGKAFLLGTGISGVASVIFGIYVYLLLTVIAPDLTAKMIECNREMIRSGGGTQEVIITKLAEFDKEVYMWENPFLQSFVMLMTVLMIGIVISLVSAAILRRKESIPIIN